MLTISNEEITFKEFLENDEDFLTYISWCRDMNNIRMIGRQEYLLSMNSENIYNYVKALNNSQNDSFFKVYIENDFAGTFKIGHIDWRLGTGDVGIMIGNALFRGKGYSTKIVRLGILYAFNTLNLRRLEGGCYSTNIAMCQCFKNCGFQREGEAREALLMDNGGGVLQPRIFWITKKRFIRF